MATPSAQITQLLEKGQRDRAEGPCEVKFVEDTKINKRKCLMIQVKHEEQRAPYEFHLSRIFIDEEMKIPVRYAAYDWPTSPDAKPQLMEEYTYVNVKLNPGLTDEDFDYENEKYRFVRH